MKTWMPGYLPDIHVFCLLSIRLLSVRKCRKLFQEFIASLTKGVQSLFAVDFRWVGNTPMSPLGPAEEYRTVLVGVVANRNDVIEFLSRKFVNRLRSQAVAPYADLIQNPFDFQF